MTKNKKSAASWVLVSLLLFASTLAASEKALQIKFPVEKYKLKNGLTVILAEDHSVPMISYHTWYRVGSRDEAPGITGAAHMLEHMMFKGAEKYSGKDFDQILHENGIVNNAFTSADYTGYYENLPSSKLELIMDVEVDRMRKLAINAEDLTSELQVVGEERRWRVDNNPGGLLRELMMGTIYKVHPYTWPVIGYMTDIQAYTPAKLRKFYDTFYVPNNAVIVLAGDFDPVKTKAMIEKYYSKLKARPLPPRSYPKEPEATAPQEKVLAWDVQTKSFVTAFKGVEAGHPDSFALDLAAAILGGGSSSRLFKKMVYQQQVSTSVSAYNMTTADPGVFMVTSTLKPGQDVVQAQKTVLAQIEDMKKNRVTERELQKVKNQTMMEFMEGLTTIDGKAQSLAINEIVFGDHNRLFEDLEKYTKVTPADVQRVMKTYAVPEKRVVAILEPKTKMQ
jgi:zinc protease